MVYESRRHAARDATPNVATTAFDKRNGDNGTIALLSLDRTGVEAPHLREHIYAWTTRAAAEQIASSLEGEDGTKIKRRKLIFEDIGEAVARHNGQTSALFTSRYFNADLTALSHGPGGVYFLKREIETGAINVDLSYSGVRSGTRLIYRGYSVMRFMPECNPQGTLIHLASERGQFNSVREARAHARRLAQC